MGGLSCGANCAKYILFFFNFLFFLIGGALLAAGIYIKVDPNTNELLEILSISGSNQQLHLASILVIIVGSLIFIVGFFGCCGACKESTCMLCVYAVLIGIIVILQIGCAVIALIFKSSMGEELRQSMKEEVLKSVHNTTEDSVTKAWYSLQYKLHCCGANGPNDYEGSVYRNETKHTLHKYVPLTCCKLSGGDSLTPKVNDKRRCQTEARDYEPGVDTVELYSEGCYQELKEYLNSEAVILIAIAAGLCVIEIFGIILACCLRREINLRDGAY